MAIVNEVINKIYQPDTEAGWTKSYLTTFGFDFFSNKTIKTHYKQVLKILNKYLPYFYYYTGIKQLNDNGMFDAREIHKIIIDDNIYDQITIASTKECNYMFSKNIFEYASFIAPQILKHSNFEKQNLLEKEQQEQYAQVYKNFINIQLQSNQILAQNKHGGIYGLYSVAPNGDQALQYIGLTNRPALERQTEHTNIINGLPDDIPEGMEKLYLLLKSQKKSGYQFIMKILISFDDLTANKALTQNDKESMELALIHLFKPKGNTSGVDIPYKYSCAA